MSSLEEGPMVAKIKELWSKAPPLKSRTQSAVIAHPEVVKKLKTEMASYPEALDSAHDAVDALTAAMRAGIPSKTWIAHYGKTVSEALAKEVAKAGMGVIDDPIPVEPPPEAFFVASSYGETYQYVKRSGIAIGDDLDIDPEDLGYVGMRPASDLVLAMTEKIEMLEAEMTLLRHQLSQAEAAISDFVRSGVSIGVATGTVIPVSSGPYAPGDPGYVSDPYWTRPYSRPIDPSEPIEASWNPSAGGVEPRKTPTFSGIDVSVYTNNANEGDLK